METTATETTRDASATRVVYGVNDLELDLAGRRITMVYTVLEQVLNIPRDASVTVNGGRVDDEYVVRPGDEIEFLKSAGAGSLSGPRRSRTLTTRIALPIARNPRATARPQPLRRADRTTGRTVNGPAPCRTIGRPPSHQRVVRSVARRKRSINRSTPNSDPLTRLHRKEGCPEREST